MTSAESIQINQRCQMLVDMANPARRVYIRKALACQLSPNKTKFLTFSCEYSAVDEKRTEELLIFSASTFELLRCFAPKMMDDRGGYIKYGWLDDCHIFVNTARFNHICINIHTGEIRDFVLPTLDPDYHIGDENDDIEHFDMNGAPVNTPKHFAQSFNVWPVTINNTVQIWGVLEYALRWRWSYIKRTALFTYDLSDERNLLPRKSGILNTEEKLLAIFKDSIVTFKPLGYEFEPVVDYVYPLPRFSKDNPNLIIMKIRSGNSLNSIINYETFSYCCPGPDANNRLIIAALNQEHLVLFVHALEYVRVRISDNKDLATGLILHHVLSGDIARIYILACTPQLHDATSTDDNERFAVHVYDLKSRSLLRTIKLPGNVRNRWRADRKTEHLVNILVPQGLELLQHESYLHIYNDSHRSSVYVLPLRMRTWTPFYHEHFLSTSETKSKSSIFLLMCIISSPLLSSQFVMPFEMWSLVFAHITATDFFHLNLDRAHRLFD